MSAAAKVIREAPPTEMMSELRINDEKVLLIPVKWLTLLWARPTSLTHTKHKQSKGGMMSNALGQDLRPENIFPS